MKDKIEKYFMKDELQEKIDSYYLLLINNYRTNMLNEGWLINLSHHVIYDQDNTVDKKYRILVASTTITKTACQNAINNARLHGIICTNHGEVTDIDEELFKNNICLWQASQLGLL